ncbi:MAG: DUF354 domain-containing protein [Nitrosopumilaceae archaeon]
MKIWFDVLTPKQVLFFEPMIKRLRKKHRVFCTSRQYREVNQLAKMRKMSLIFVGRHGGSERSEKLKASLGRMNELTKIIKKFSPDVAVSFCSPEATRVSFGLGIKHIAFCDSPHAEAVMKISIPLVDRLLIPWIISKNEFSKYGISAKKITSYKAIDASIIIKNKSNNSTFKFKNKKKKTILIRPYESQASYANYKETSMISIIQKISKLSNYNVLLLARNFDQIKKLKKKFGKKFRVLNTVDNNEIFSFTDVFIGSGGTMTAEAALRGIPTISYNAVPNIVEDYLVKKCLIKREENPQKIVPLIEKLLKSNKNKFKKNAKTELSRMEDPYFKLIHAIKSITE